MGRALSDENMEGATGRKETCSADHLRQKRYALRFRSFFLEWSWRYQLETKKADVRLFLLLFHAGNG
jgi:hypothetical protein